MDGLPVMPASAPQPTAAAEVDSKLHVGRVGASDVRGARADVIVPASVTTTVSAGVDAERWRTGTATYSRLVVDGAVAVSPPLGKPTLKGHLQLGGRVRRTAGQAYISPNPLWAGLPSTRAAITAGGSLVARSPDWLARHLVGTSVLIIAEPDPQGNLKPGFELTAFASRHLWGNDPVGWMVAVEARRDPGADWQVHVPVGAYVLAQRHSIIGVEAGPSFWRGPSAWASGAQIGVRVSGFATPEDLRRWTSTR